MEDIRNYNDFKRKLTQKLFNAKVGINSDNYQTIVDAFDDEISETYNMLIADKVDEINKIDIDNSYQTFEKSFRTHGDTTPQFKENIMKNFDTAKDENCKIMLATITLSGTSFVQNEERDIFGNRQITCYNERDDVINIMNVDMNNQEDLFHEGFHAVFNRYNVKDTDLKAVMKKELNHTEKIDTIFEYFEDEYCKENNLPSKKELIAKREELRNKQNEIYNKVLNEATKNHGGLKTAEAYSEAHRVLREQHPEYTEMETEFWKLNHQIDRIEKTSDNRIGVWYPNLYDMISGATRNKRGYGHSKKYWNSDKMNQVNEFFAEMSAMKATGNTQEYELVRRFAPNSVKRYEEIFNDILKNRGKALEL